MSGAVRSSVPHRRRRGRGMGIEFKVRIDPEVKAELAAYAAETNQSMSLLVDDALADLVAKVRTTQRGAA